MAKIKNTRVYPRDLSLSGDEILIGSDIDENGKTKNYRLEDIARYVFEGRAIPGINQNNISVVMDVGNIDPSNSNRTIADAVNSIDEFTVNEDEIFYFSGFKTSSANIDNDTTDGSGFAAHSPETIITKHLYLFKRGKGRYGASINNPTSPVLNEDFLLIEEEAVSLSSVYGEQPIVYSVPNIEGKSAVNAINDSGDTYTITLNSDVYFRIGNVSGNTDSHIYRFVGSAGTYGQGGQAISSEDLLTLKEAGVSTSGTTNIKILEFDTVLLGQTETKAQSINNFGRFQVTQNELALFSFRRVLPDGRIEKSTWFSKRGAGIFGSAPPGQVFQMRPWMDSDLVLNEKSIHFLVSQTPGNGPSLSVEYKILPSDESKTISQAINVSPDPIVVDSDLHTNVIEHNDRVYQFIGADGTYGIGHNSCSDKDLYELDPSDKHLGVNAESIHDKNNKFTGYNEFDKRVSVKGIKLESQSQLPLNPEEGLMVKFYNELVIYANGYWNKISSTPLNS